MEEASLIKCKVLVIHHWFSRTVHLTKLPVIFKSKELSCAFFFLFSSLFSPFFLLFCLYNSPLRHLPSFIRGGVRGCRLGMAVGRGRQAKIMQQFSALCTGWASGNPKCITLGKHSSEMASLSLVFFFSFFFFFSSSWEPDAVHALRRRGLSEQSELS